MSQKDELDDTLFPDDDYERFEAWFYNRTGIVFGPAKRAFVERRLHGRIKAAGSDSLRTFLGQLRLEDTEGGQAQRIVNALTINETYFNREIYQFRCLTASLLPELVHGAAAVRRPLRIWSVPCSTGEEPFGIAIYLLDHWRDVDRFEVEIIGSDIDSSALTQAEAGVFEDRSLRHLPDAALRRYFIPREQGRWQVAERLRQSVDFSAVNVCNSHDMSAYRDHFDVIFCRNLLIYFDESSRRRALEHFHAALRPGGYLCLGHSESIARSSSLFTIRKYPDAMVYQKSTR